MMQTCTLKDAIIYYINIRMVFVVLERIRPDSVYWLGIVGRGVYATEALALAKVEGMGPGSWFISEHTVQGDTGSIEKLVKEQPLEETHDKPQHH